jgi:D-aminopeptidase
MSRARLPNLQQPAPGALHLCHNQSGLRDYWAVAMLHGAPAESPFGDAEAARSSPAPARCISPRARATPTSTRTSAPVGHPAGPHRPQLRRAAAHPHLRPAGMASALLAADTRAMPDGTEGYEGTQAGRLPRRGEPHPVDRRCRARRQPRRHDRLGAPHRRHARRPASLYSRLSAPVSLRRRRPASYGFGLGRGPPSWAAAVTGHGGGLRGWRSHRLYAPRSASRSSSCSTTWRTPTTRRGPAGRRAGPWTGRRAPPACPPPAWLGAYVEPETGLSVRIDIAPPGQVRLRYGHTAELLDLQRRRHGGRRQQRPAAARRGRALDGPPAREPVLAAAPLLRRRPRPTSPAATAARNWTPS